MIINTFVIGCNKNQSLRQKRSNSNKNINFEGYEVVKHIPQTCLLNGKQYRATAKQMLNDIDALARKSEELKQKFFNKFEFFNPEKEILIETPKAKEVILEGNSPPMTYLNSLAPETGYYFHSVLGKVYYTFPGEDITDEMKKQYPYIIVPKSSKHELMIMDEGRHYKNLFHLGNALSDNIEIKSTPVKSIEATKLNLKLEALKDMKNLRDALHYINNKADRKPEFLALPTLCNVGLLNLSDRVEAIIGKRINLTPQNIKSNKTTVIELLKKIHDDPCKYRQEIGYMDKDSQGMEHVYGVIQEINQLVKSGINVFIAAGHPYHTSMDYLTRINDARPEYSYYLATGNDTKGTILKLKSKCQNDNWYEFNLLTLSEAQNIGITKPNDEKFFHTAYDSCVTDYSRGTFNFSPVRKNGEIEGYSFLDQSNVHFKKEELNENIYIEKFIGLKVKDVLASDEEHRQFEKLLTHTGEKSESDISFLKTASDKLFKVEDIFSPQEIKEKKIHLQGKYVDASLKLFFDENKYGQIIFFKCDSEASGRPSIFSMWGTCLSVINKIAQNINGFRPKLTKMETIPQPYVSYEYNQYLNKAKIPYGINVYEKEAALNKALGIKKQVLGDSHPSLIKDYIEIGDFLLQRHHSSDYDNSENCYNEALRIAKANFHPKAPVIADCYMKIAEACSDRTEYYKKNSSAMDCLNEAIDIYSYSDEGNKNISGAFNKLAKILRLEKKDIFAEVCEKAAKEIEGGTLKGKEIIKKRANGERTIAKLNNQGVYEL
jgi:hypothetical protein